MVKKCMAAAVLVSAGVLLASLLRADASADLKAAVDKSMKAMGAENLKTLVISGEGWDGCVGQPYNPNTAWWRKFSNKNYVRSIDFDARGWRLQRVRGEGENPARGGCGAGPIADTNLNGATTNLSQARFGFSCKFFDDFNAVHPAHKFCQQGCVVPQPGADLQDGIVRFGGQQVRH